MQAESVSPHRRFSLMPGAFPRRRRTLDRWTFRELGRGFKMSLPVRQAQGPEPAEGRRAKARSEEAIQPDRRSPHGGLRDDRTF